MATKKTIAPTATNSYLDAMWRAEDDMRTLARAEEVKADPKRLAAAKRMAAAKLSEMKAVANLSAK